MAYELEMVEEKVLRMAFIGDIDEEEARAYYAELENYLSAASNKAPIHVISHIEKVDSFSAGARRSFAEMNQDHRIGKIGVIGASPIYETLGSLIMRVTNRKNIRFFDGDAEALNWMRNSG